MKTQFSDPEYAKRIALLQQQAMHVYPPAIPFKKKKKKDSEDEDDTQYKKIKVPIGDDPEQTTEWKVPIFENGEPEEWIKWVLQFHQLVDAYPSNDPDHKNNIIRTLLQGEALDLYNTKYSEGRAPTTNNQKE